MMNSKKNHGKPRAGYLSKERKELTELLNNHNTTLAEAMIAAFKAGYVLKISLQPKEENPFFEKRKFPPLSPRAIAYAKSLPPLVMAKNRI